MAAAIVKKAVPWKLTSARPTAAPKEVQSLAGFAPPGGVPHLRIGLEVCGAAA